MAAWEFWWGYNRDPYLNLRASVHASAVQTGTDEWFLGRDQLEDSRDLWRPSRTQVHDVVLPALKRALERESSNDIVTGALIALAKIGDTVGPAEGEELSQLIEGFLGHPVQEVAETACIALGILGDPHSAERLSALLTDAAEARRLIGKTEVPYRTRAFAAYGLGLIGNRSGDALERQRIVGALIEILDAQSFSTRDIKVAAMIALGMVPLDPDPTTGGHWEAETPERREVVSREAQLAWLLDCFDPRQERAHSSTRHWFVRAHAPAALARLVAVDDRLSPLAPYWRERVAETLLATIREHSQERAQVEMGAALALGQIGTSAAGGVDSRIRSALIRTVSEGNRQSRRFALIALAQIGGRLGAGELGDAGTGEVARVLQLQLARGKTELRPWAGLAMGVLAHRLNETDRPRDGTLLRALVDAAADCRNPRRIGAYLIALGIARHEPAGAICLEKLEYFKGDDDARGYAAISLGLLGRRDAIPRLSQLVAEAKHKPPLMKQAAIALGLLGDKALVDDLVDMLARQARTVSSQAAVSSALGAIGDSRSIDPLVEMLGNRQITETARAFAAVALGIVCDEDHLPWNSRISVDLNYRANTVTLTGAGGKGILNLL